MRRDLKAEFAADGKPSAIPTIMLLLIAMIIAFASPHRETASTTKSSDSLMTNRGMTAEARCVAVATRNRQ